MGAKRVGADPEGPPLPSLRDLSGTSGRDIMYTSSRDLSCASGRDLSCTSGLDVPPTAPTRARSESFDSLTTEMQRATTVGSRLLLQQRAPPSWLRAAQQRLRAAYASTPAQLGLAVLIAANFVVSAVEAQLRWSTAAPSSEAAFLGIEIFFTVVFTAELLVNMAAHWLRPFWTSGWNVFDLAIIAVAWASLAADDVPGVSVLRLFRAFRVFRLFKRVHSLRSIIQGVLNAMPAIANTFGVLAIIVRATPRRAARGGGCAPRAPSPQIATRGGDARARRWAFGRSSASTCLGAPRRSILALLAERCSRCGKSSFLTVGRRSHGS